MGKNYDIRRRKQEVDTTLGGVTITSTAIETRYIELQTLSTQEVLALGGLRIEGTLRGFCHKDTNIREGDVISPNSGTTRYEVTDVEDLLDEHIQFIAKKAD